MTLSSTARAQLEALSVARNADGGWGYARGRASRLEPTCLALLALAAAGTRPDHSVIVRWPSEEGLLLDPQSRAVNASDNAVALLAAQHPAIGAPAFAARLATALAAMKGVKLPPSSTNRQDNALQGWPWVANTFSWVEPTAWCVLALRKWTHAHRDASIGERVMEGERLLLDRVCRNGGWNYGNSNVLGKELPAYVPTTAIALLALQGRRDQDAVKKSLAYYVSPLPRRTIRPVAVLVPHRSRGVRRPARSRALGSAGPGLQRSRRTQKSSGANVEPGLQSRLKEIEAALAETWQATEYLGNIPATALALYAEAGAEENHVAFRI